MLNLSGKVRFGKVYLSSDYKACHNVNVFSQGLLQLTCAKFAYGGWILGSSQFTAPAVSKNDAWFKSGQNRLENNLLDSLI